MQLHSKFVGTFLMLFLRPASKADISESNFDTISSSQRLQNGSYLFQGLEVTLSRLRGCVCQLKPCIWFCCRFIDMQSKKKPDWSNSFLRDSIIKRNLLKDFIMP